jgi:hypothetical protein
VIPDPDDYPTCAIQLPSHIGTPATWRDRNNLMTVCDRHRSQYDERADDLGPFDWEEI